MRLPEYLKKKIYCGPNLFEVEKIIGERGLETVCSEARCPNRGECWASGTATFLILGKYCTRNCGFCSVEKGAPLAPDISEPKKIASAVLALKLRHVVITSVTRDDLPDGGANHFARVIREIRWENPQTKIEVLIPDFKGQAEALKIVLDARPDVLAHNVETVPRLYKTVRPKANYKRSLKVLLMSKIQNPKIPTKSGMMLGLGETKKEILKAMADLRKVDCDFLTLGQYLAPSRNHLAVERFVLPEEFDELKTLALEMGFKNVASGPLVRSSYQAEKLLSKN